MKCIKCNCPLCAEQSYDIEWRGTRQNKEAIIKVNYQCVKCNESYTIEGPIKFPTNYVTEDGISFVPKATLLRNFCPICMYKSKDQAEETGIIDNGICRLDKSKPVKLKDAKRSKSSHTGTLRWHCDKCDSDILLPFKLKSDIMNL